MPNRTLCTPISPYCMPDNAIEEKKKKKKKN